MAQVSIRIGTAQDRVRVRAVYEIWGYDGGLQSGDTLFLAERAGELLGAVRLALEGDAHLLRGLHVAPEARRQGIGTQLLHALVSRLGAAECYCVPYVHLVRFFRQAAFDEWPLDRAPASLVDQMAQYRHAGLAVTLMRRAGARRDAEG